MPKWNGRNWCLNVKCIQIENTFFVALPHYQITESMALRSMTKCRRNSAFTQSTRKRIYVLRCQTINHFLGRKNERKKNLENMNRRRRVHNSFDIWLSHFGEFHFHLLSNNSIPGFFACRRGSFVYLVQAQELLCFCVASIKLNEKDTLSPLNKPTWNERVRKSVNEVQNWMRHKLCPSQIQSPMSMSIYLYSDHFSCSNSPAFLLLSPSSTHDMCISSAYIGTCMCV